MTASAILRASLSTFRVFEQELTGFTVPENGLCYLVFSGESAVKVFVWGMDVSPRFECFSLAMEACEKAAGHINSFATQKGAAVTSVLVREEYIEPFTGDSSGFLGRPQTSQKASKPGHVPQHALESCLVAYGILIERRGERLVIAADWFPYKMTATTDETQIAVFLSESELVPLPQYMRENGFS